MIQRMILYNLNINFLHFIVNRYAISTYNGSSYQLYASKRQWCYDMSARFCMKGMRYFMMLRILNFNSYNLTTEMIYYYMIMYFLIVNVFND